MKRNIAPVPFRYKRVRNRQCLFLAPLTGLSACGGETGTETVSDEPVAVEADFATAGAAEWDYENTN